MGRGRNEQIIWLVSGETVMLLSVKASVMASPDRLSHISSSISTFTLTSLLIFPATLFMMDLIFWIKLRGSWAYCQFHNSFRNAMIGFGQNDFASAHSGGGG